MEKPVLDQLSILFQLAPSSFQQQKNPVFSLEVDFPLQTNIWITKFPNQCWMTPYQLWCDRDFMPTLKSICNRQERDLETGRPSICLHICFCICVYKGWCILAGTWDLMTSVCLRICLCICVCICLHIYICICVYFHLQDTRAGVWWQAPVIQ